MADRGRDGLPLGGPERIDREALRWIAEADYLVIRAGIRASDAVTTVNPGCCADLEGWHEWPRTWLGHDPEPWVEQVGASLLIHQEKPSKASATSETSQDPVKVAADAVPGLLAELREDLIAFLAAAERWAVGIAADTELAASVIANIDRHTVIGVPTPKIAVGTKR